MQLDIVILLRNLSRFEFIGQLKEMPHIVFYNTKLKKQKNLIQKQNVNKNLEEIQNVTAIE